MFRDILFSRTTPFNPSKSKLWVEIFAPFSHQHLIGFFHTVSIANFKQSCEFAQKCPRAGKDEVFDKTGFFGTVWWHKYL
jgi:hypothetical protein